MLLTPARKAPTTVPRTTASTAATTPGTAAATPVSTNPADGTDMIAIVADPEAPLRLSDAGKHSKPGELIRRGVIDATLAALERQTGLSPASQRNLLARPHVSR